MFLSVIFTVIHAQFFAIQLVAAVHGVRRVAGLLPDSALCLFLFQARHPIRGDRTGEQELHRLVVLLRPIGCHHQQLHRAFHVDAVRLLARHLSLRGKRSRQVEDHIEIIIVEGLDLVNQVPLRVLRRHIPDAVGQRSQIRCDDLIAALPCQTLYQRLTNLATCTGHQYEFFGHRISLRAVKCRVKR
jgi:hypothetical protein